MGRSGPAPRPVWWRPSVTIRMAALDGPDYPWDRVANVGHGPSFGHLPFVKGKGGKRGDAISRDGRSMLARPRVRAVADGRGRQWRCGFGHERRRAPGHADGRRRVRVPRERHPEERRAADRADPTVGGRIYLPGDR